MHTGEKVSMYKKPVINKHVVRKMVTFKDLIQMASLRP